MSLLSKNNSKNKDTLSVAVMLGVCVLYGFSFMFTRLAVDGISTATLISWRCGISLAAMSLLRLFGVMKINLRGKKLLPVILPAIFQPTLYFIFETAGIRLTSASESGLLVATSPIIAMVLEMLILSRKPTPVQAAAIPLTAIGVAILIIGGGIGEATFDLAGYAFLMAAVLAGGLFQVFSAKTTEFTVTEKTYVMMITGTVSFTAWAAVEHIADGTVTKWLTLPFTSPVFAVTVLYLGLGCSILGFMGQNYAIENIGVTRSAAFGGIVTVITVFSGIVILREPFSWLQGVGAAVVFIGVYGSNVSRATIKKLLHKKR